MVTLDASQDYIDRHNELVLLEILRIIAPGKKLLGFDQDGTVGFTERRQFRGFAGLVTKHTGIELDYRELAERMLGRTETDIIAALCDEYGIVGDVPTLLNERGELYFNSVVSSPIEPHPCVVKICKEQIKTGGLEPIIITNGRLSIQAGLLEHWGIRNLFGAVHASDTICLDLPLDKRKRAFVKSLPEIYKVKPSDVIIFEDSEGMVRFAEENGMSAVFVHHKLNRPVMPKSGLILLCDSLHRAPYPA